jgi:protein-arginine kinase activator protein McsA
MLCEKCQAKPARVHIKERAQGSTGEAPSDFIEHHLCEDCGRDFIQSDPRFKHSWSKPEGRYVLETFNPTSRRKPT